MNGIKKANERMHLRRFLCRISLIYFSIAKSIKNEAKFVKFSHALDDCKKKENQSKEIRFKRFLEQFPSRDEFSTDENHKMVDEKAWMLRLSLPHFSPKHTKRHNPEIDFSSTVHAFILHSNWRRGMKKTPKWLIYNGWWNVVMMGSQGRESRRVFCFRLSTLHGC